jgi:tetratricopeptide (TPR) repeat protein
MISIGFTKTLKQERQFNFFRFALLSLIFCFISIYNYAQDSIPEKEDLTEEAELKFQNFFFKALSDKSIGNYQKAIENLESCNQLLENNTAIYFEFSKNYLLLNKTNLAKEYVMRALQKEPNNIWMLKHLVKVYQKENNLEDAIVTQKKVVAISSKEKPFLVRLYLYNRDYDKAILLMELLQNENALTSDLKRIKQRLNARKIPEQKVLKLNDISVLQQKFEKDKSYETLEQILKISESNISILLKYSKEGIALFPAQPFVYLMKAYALNSQKMYKDALTTLKNGIDFVIEEQMEVNFYLEMANSFKGLGDVDEENKYKEKAKQLKS